MSFRTYGGYNSDNVVKTIEKVPERSFKDIEEGDPMKKILKDAILVYVYSEANSYGKRGRTTYEKLLGNRGWFDWTARCAYSNDEFVSMLRSINENNWEAFTV